MIGSLGVKIHVISYLVVGGISVREVVMRVIVEIVHFKGRGLVLVGRDFMTGLLVMLRFRYVEQPVVKC